MSPHRMTELSFIKLQRDPIKLNVFQVVNIIFFDEAGQMFAELLSILDIMLREFRNNNIPFRGVMFLCTMDHTQLAPIKGKPFLVSSHILCCLKMFRLEHSVRANEDLDFQKRQQIARMYTLK